MDILQSALYYILLLLIRIGDGVILILSFFTYFFSQTTSFLTWIINGIKSVMLFIFKKLTFLPKTIYKSTHRIYTKNSPKNRRRSPIKTDGLQPVTVSKKGSAIKYFLYGSTFSLIFFFLPASVYLFLQELPSPKALTTRQIAQTTKIYDRNGLLLTQIYGAQDRTVVSLNEIPDSLKKATVAIEDKNFYTHPGFDVTAILRALKEDIEGRSFQGASTITQQLVRSSFLTNETTITRKIKEVIVAFWTERLYSKDQILEMYFNQIPYGGTAWGVEAASDVYFGKHVKDLTLAESAFLAGITTAPTLYSPYGQDPNKWKIRQKEVLNQMKRLGFISAKQQEDALHEELDFKHQPTAIYAPHFVNYVKELLAQKYGEAMLERGGLTITTSLNMETQKKAEEIVREEVDNAAYLNLTNGALLVTNPKNGDVLAMVGSRDFNDQNGGNVNVTTALRQPGSSIKAITYAAGLNKGMTAATIIDDSPTTYKSPGGPSYSPVNYDGKFHGRVPLRIALANSFNIPAVKILDEVGIDTMVTLAKRMGIDTWKSPDNYGLSITLGAAEVRMTDMAEVYGTFANEGDRVDLSPILKITDDKGETIEEKTETSAKTHVLSAAVSYIISSILSDNSARTIEFGPNSPLNIPGHTVSVKTGTTDNKRDNWTIGYTPDILVATWVGNNDNSPMSQSLASGITGAAPIWNRMMSYMLEQHPEPTLAVPENITAKPCNGRIEYFVSGTETNASCRGWSGTPSTFPSPTSFR